MLVATADPLDLGALDDIRAQLGTEIFPVLVPSQKILDAINHVYGQRHDKGGELGETEEDEMAGGAEELVDILDVNDEAPIIRWVNSLLFNAVKERASDIHIEPGREGGHRSATASTACSTRSGAPPASSCPRSSPRVKIMAGLNIAEKRLPQDGRIRRKIAGKDIDMRVATAPTVKGGERITIRLLDRENVLHDLADIGFGDDHLRRWTSSSTGRTASCWSPGPPARARPPRSTPACRKINSPDLNILTIEDPVEYQLDGISQVAVNDKIDLTFATGLRSFLRHDPDVIMVGEIRDLPTAEIAIQASLTGHLVLSTIHTNDARGGHHPAGRAGGAAVPGGHLAGGAAGPAPGAAGLPASAASSTSPPTEDLTSMGLDPGRLLRRARPAGCRSRREAPPAAGHAVPAPAKAAARTAWAPATGAEPPSTSC